VRIRSELIIDMIYQQIKSMAEIDENIYLSIELVRVDESI
jgi:hypothetical protein